MSGETRTFSEGQLRELLDGAEVIGRDHWRHGYRQLMLFEHDGKHWATWIDVHPLEGWQVGGSQDAVRMVPEERVVEVWTEWNEDRHP